MKNVQISYMLIAQSANYVAHDIYFIALCALVFGDILTGYAKAIYGYKGNSKKGMKGVVKHMFVISGVAVLCIFWHLLKLDFLMTGIILAFIGTYGISICENLGQMGIIIPKWLSDRLEKLSHDYNENPKGEKKND